MPYPDSPFSDEINVILREQIADSNVPLPETLKWLCECPNFTFLRINTFKTTVEDAKNIIEEMFLESGHEVELKYHELIKDVLILQHKTTNSADLIKFPNEIIIDPFCGSSVLRGAHIYAPGVVGMLSNTKVGDKVSVCVDVDKKCNKGFNKIFEGNKVFIANGIVKMARFELFAPDIEPSGIAIEITETLSGCPSINTETFPKGIALLQNLPSIICVQNLSPQSGEIILDMCASPGNKATYIAQLMQNTGILIGIDKTSNRVKKLIENCQIFEAKVYCFEADSRKIADNNIAAKTFEKGPPFAFEFFDRILLDGPCSGFGKRPQFANFTNPEMLRSFPALQRKLFDNAVKLLKPSGTLVYSTCTITLSENEEIVDWALNKYPNLKLFKPDLCLGGPGWPGRHNLSANQLQCLQRFGPNQIVDCTGFFIACFHKI